MPEVGPLPDQGVEDGGDAQVPSFDVPAGDADGGSANPPDVVGDVFVRQYVQTLALRRSAAGGRIEDRRSADITETRTDLSVTLGSCQLIQTQIDVPGAGVQISGVDFTVEQTTIRSFSLSSSFTGDLSPPPTFPDEVINAGFLQQVTFDLEAGSGTGRPEDIADFAVSGPRQLAVDAPIPTAPLPTGLGINFVFSSALLPGDRLVVRLFDRADAPGVDSTERLECEVSAISTVSYFIAPETLRAFFDLAPEEPVLEIGLVETRTATPGVQGGGEARITFEVFRGALYENVLPP